MIFLKKLIRTLVSITLRKMIERKKASKQFILGGEEKISSRDKIENKKKCC